MQKKQTIRNVKERVYLVEAMNVKARLANALGVVVEMEVYVKAHDGTGVEKLVLPLPIEFAQRVHKEMFDLFARVHLQTKGIHA